MPSLLKINVTVNLSPLLNVNRYQKKNQATITSVAAERYLRYLKNRHLANAAGSGQWEPLAQSTIERKERRGIAENPYWVLREYDVIISALGIREINGIKYVGFVRDRKHPRGLSVFQLVRIHTKGLGRLPARQVLGLPDNSTKQKMVDDVRKEYNKKIRQEKKK